MTKKEAIAEMEKGVKITHRYFTSDEWMTFKGKKIIFEDGETLSKSEFWIHRRGVRWNNEYSIYCA